MVNGPRLNKITNEETGAFTDIGLIEGSEQIRTSIGFVDAVIIVRGGKSYTLSTTDVLDGYLWKRQFCALCGHRVHQSADHLCAC